jgi:AcrR family transcriptional regulator
MAQTRPRSANPERRRELLDAARRLIAEKGYDTLAVHEIVAEAGVAQGTFYLYFKGKDDLPHALAEDLVAEIADAAAALGGDGSPAERLAELTEAVHAVGARNRDVLVVAEQALAGVRTNEEWKMRVEPLRAAVESALVDTPTPALSAVVAEMLLVSARHAAVYRDGDFAAASAAVVAAGVSAFSRP